MFQKQSTSFLPQNNKNMSFSIVDNISMVRPSEPKLVGNKKHNSGDSSTVNSSFFFNPVGYCENPGVS
jgi:hypothetical protein